MEEHHLHELTRHVDRKEYTRAWDYVERLLSFEAENVPLLHFAADLAAAATDYHSELRYCGAAFRAEPGLPSLRRLAQALSHAERWEQAAEAWMLVAGTLPLDVEAWQQASLALCQLGRDALASALAAGAERAASLCERGAAALVESSTTNRDPKLKLAAASTE
jgi:tetratricopeptide (TPR) repeat protein